MCGWLCCLYAVREWYNLFGMNLDFHCELFTQARPKQRRHSCSGEGNGKTLWPWVPLESYVHSVHSSEYVGCHTPWVSSEIYDTCMSDVCDRLSCAPCVLNVTFYRPKLCSSPNHFCILGQVNGLNNGRLQLLFFKSTTIPPS